MSGRLILACVPPGLIDRVWPRVADMVDRGYEAGDDFMPQDMVSRLLSGKVLLWVAMNEDDGSISATLTTELVRMRSGLACWMCQAAGSKVDEWKAFHEKIEEYAKAEGCVKVIIRGRAGWQKKLNGFSVRNVQLEKVL